MILLALDTAANLCSVAVFDAARGQVLAEMSEDIGRGHAERLMPMVERTLADAGLNLADLSAVAVSTGPGSFTGLCVGLSAAKGLGQGLGIPVIGIPVTDGLAWQARETGVEGPLAVVLDARRDAVYVQRHEPGVTFGEPPRERPLAEAVQLLKTWPTLVGNGAPLVAADGHKTILADARTCDAPTLARMAAAILAAGQQAAHPPAALYVRGADAREQSGFALPRATADGAAP